ncbi:MAG TPA: hypothetical protein VFQ79_23495 [Bryobacteraceae bacterium]|nr:hypothetical protein [Bryobacteraceae bacterium]
MLAALMEKECMNGVQEQDKAEQSATVFPALIQVQGIPGVLLSARPGNRRIRLLLDHPIARNLGAFSWLLLAVGLSAGHPRMAVIVGGTVFIGLLIGLVNGARWLFGKSARHP